MTRPSYSAQRAERRHSGEPESSHRSTGGGCERYKTKPIGAGPYRVSSSSRRDRVVMESFDEWHSERRRSSGHCGDLPDATTRVLELRGSVNSRSQFLRPGLRLREQARIQSAQEREQRIVTVHSTEDRS